MKQEKLRQYIKDNCLTGYSLEWTDLSLQQLEHMKGVIDEIISGKVDNYIDRYVEESNRKFFKLYLEELNTLITDDTSDWAYKYDICWTIKDQMFKYTRFDWCDPDGSYEGDVMAFYQAASIHLEEWES